MPALIKPVNKTNKKICPHGAYMILGNPTIMTQESSLIHSCCK